MIDTDKPGHVKKAVLTVNPITQLPITNYALVGAVSTNPAIVIEGSSLQFLGGTQYTSNPTRPAVALAGRIPVKVNLEGGEIKGGDPITISSQPGIGKKATESGKIIGYSLGNYTETEAQRNRETGQQGTVLVFVSLEHYQAPGTSDSVTNSLLAQLIDTVKSWLESMQVFIENGLVRLKELVADKLTARKAVLDKIELKDEDTGEVYCVRMKSGVLVSTPGECSQQVENSNTQETDSNSDTTTTSDSQLNGPSQAPPPPSGLNANDSTDGAASTEGTQESEVNINESALNTEMTNETAPTEEAQESGEGETVSQ
jgi:hypothetical protein